MVLICNFELLISFKVFLVDYGSTCDLPKANILPIPESLLDQPGQAVICHLDEIEPFDKEWDEECHDMFTQQCKSIGIPIVATII